MIIISLSITQLIFMIVKDILFIISSLVFLFFLHQAWVNDEYQKASFYGLMLILLTLYNR